MNKDDLFKKYGVSPETHELDTESGKFVPRAQLSAPSSNEVTIRALRGGIDAPFNAIRESKPAVSMFGPTDKMVEQAGPGGYKPAGNLIERKGLIPGAIEGLSKPVKEIPHIPNEAPLPDSAHWLQKGLRAKDDIVAGVSNVGIGAANFMQSPLGAGAAMAASVPALIRPLAAAFTADSAANVPGTFKEVGRSFEEGGTLQDKAQALTGAAANLGFGAAGAHGMKARPLAAGPLSNYDGWLKDVNKWEDFDGPPAMQPEQQQMAGKRKTPKTETQPPPEPEAYKKSKLKSTLDDIWAENDRKEAAPAGLEAGEINRNLRPTDYRASSTQKHVVREYDPAVISEEGEVVTSYDHPSAWYKLVDANKKVKATGFVNKATGKFMSLIDVAKELDAKDRSKKAAPVPETPETLAAQVEVTKDPAAAKAATLVTPGEVTPPNAEGLGRDCRRNSARESVEACEVQERKESRRAGSGYDPERKAAGRRHCRADRQIRRACH